MDRLVSEITPDRVDLVGMLIQVLGFVLLFTGQGAGMEQGRRFFQLAQQAFTRAGRRQEANVFRGIYAAVDSLMGGMPAEDAIAEMESCVSSLRDRGAPVGVVLLYPLGRLKARVGDIDGADRLCDEILVCSELAGSPLHRLRAEELALLLDIARGDDPTAIDRHAEHVWVRGVALTPDDMPAWAADAAHAFLDVGDVERGRAWQARAGSDRDSSPDVRFLSEALAARLGFYDGDVAEASRHVQDLVKENLAAGLRGGATYVRERATLDLARLGKIDQARKLFSVCEGDVSAARRARILEALGEAGDRDGSVVSVLRIKMLAPEVILERDGQPLAPLVGYGARLLAILVAARQPVEVERLIEQLWPGIDPEVGRKRLNCILHRLRRALGAGTPGPIVHQGGTIRLQSAADVEVDVWEFLDATADEARDVEQALHLYGDHFCSRQFAQDDFAVDARLELRSRLVCAAIRHTRKQIDSGAVDGDLQDLAYRLWRLVPEDEDLCAATIEAMVKGGRRRQAKDVLGDALRHLDDSGIPTDDLRSRAEALLAG